MTCFKCFLLISTFNDDLLYKPQQVKRVLNIHVNCEGSGETAQFHQNLCCLHLFRRSLRERGRDLCPVNCRACTFKWTKLKKDIRSSLFETRLIYCCIPAHARYVIQQSDTPCHFLQQRYWINIRQ